MTFWPVENFNIKNNKNINVEHIWSKLLKLDNSSCHRDLPRNNLSTISPSQAIPASIVPTNKYKTILASTNHMKAYWSQSDLDHLELSHKLTKKDSHLFPCKHKSKHLKYYRQYDILFSYTPLRYREYWIS